MSDPFEVLGLEPLYALETKALEQRHRELSKALHPDRHSGASPSERRLALGRAIEANDAFRSLRDPVRRAEALLRRRGVTETQAEEARAPQALLLAMMEAREELQEAHAARDADKVQGLGRTMGDRQERLMRALTSALDSTTPAPPEAALSLLAELRYVRRFLDEVSALEEDLAESSGDAR